MPMTTLATIPPMMTLRTYTNLSSRVLIAVRMIGSPRRFDYQPAHSRQSQIDVSVGVRLGQGELAESERGVAYVSATAAYDATAFGASIEDHDGFVKVLADPESGEILGCHVIGTDASTLVQDAVNLMRFRLPVDVIARSIYIHPALPEVMQAAFASVAQRVARVSDHHHDEAQDEDEHGTGHS